MHKTVYYLDIYTVQPKTFFKCRKENNGMIVVRRKPKKIIIAKLIITCSKEKVETRIAVSNIHFVSTFLLCFLKQLTIPNDVLILKNKTTKES